MHWLKSVCVASCLLVVSQVSWAGVVVGGTRVVYDGSKKKRLFPSIMRKPPSLTSFNPG